jgi:hypothetical protein
MIPAKEFARAGANGKRTCSALWENTNADVGIRFCSLDLINARKHEYDFQPGVI